MESKNKLSLEELSVQSFVTNLSKENGKTINGGFTPLTLIEAIIHLLTHPDELGDSECSAGHHGESCR